jgi:hypothetical protein
VRRDETLNYCSLFGLGIILFLTQRAGCFYSAEDNLEARNLHLKVFLLLCSKYSGMIVMAWLMAFNLVKLVYMCQRVAMV